MIVTCPACAARYRVADGEFAGVHGRTVRCANCGHCWYETPGAAELGRGAEPGSPFPDLTGTFADAAEQPPVAADAPATAFAPPQRSRTGSRAAAWLAVLGMLVAAGFAAAVFTHRLPALEPAAAIPEASVPHK